jgi:DNA-binding MarR family transcriptional regulator
MPTMTMTAELSSTLRVSVMRLARRLRGERTDTSLSVSQIAALGSLSRLGPLTPSELADAEKVQPPSMTRTVAGLEARGLVSRAPHPTDRRQVLLAVTAEAEEMLRADRSRRDAWLSIRLAELTAAERDTLRAAAEVIERLAAS